MSKSAQLSLMRRRFGTCLAGSIGYGLLFLTGAQAWCQSPATAGKAERPVLSAHVSSIDKVYKDIEFIFNLAGDEKGYKTFKETLDVFVEGVETAKPCDVRMFVTEEGIRTAASLPVRNEAAFKKFLMNLWDLDVKTAPPPQAALQAQVPERMRSKLKSLKLAANEKIIFGLTDGFLRYESGHVYLGETLDAERLARGDLPAIDAKGPTVALQIDGESQAPEQKRKAFEKSREHLLSLPKQSADESAAGFVLKKAFLDYQLAKLEVLFAEASQVQAGWTISRDKKVAELHVEAAAQNDTSLAKDIERLGQSADQFAGVSQQNAALSGAINVPVDPAIAKSLKTVVREARQVVHEKIDQSSDRGADQKSIDRNFAELIFACLDDVAGMSVFDSFVRTWSNGDGTLTTVGAVQISDGEKYRELVRKFPTREGVERNATGEAGVEIHKVVVTQWRKDYQELFDRDGSVFIGTSDTALWYAFGEKARDRLEQTIHEAKENSGTKTEAAVTVHARMLPLVEVWEKIHARRPAAGAAKPKAKNEKKEEPVATRAVSTVAELNLPKIAAEAYRGGHDEISLSLSRHGPKAVWSARFDEGTLRFIGKTLSKFVKDNLED